MYAAIISRFDDSLDPNVPCYPYRGTPLLSSPLLSSPLLSSLCKNCVFLWFVFARGARPLRFLFPLLSSPPLFFFLHREPPAHTNPQVKRCLRELYTKKGDYRKLTVTRIRNQGAHLENPNIACRKSALCGYMCHDCKTGRYGTPRLPQSSHMAMRVRSQAGSVPLVELHLLPNCLREMYIHQPATTVGTQWNGSRMSWSMVRATSVVSLSTLGADLHFVELVKDWPLLYLYPSRHSSANTLFNQTGG